MVGRAPADRAGPAADRLDAAAGQPHPTVPFTLDLSTTLYFHNYRNGLLLGISNPDQDPGLVPGVQLRAGCRAFDEAAEIVAPTLAGQPLVGGWAGLYENTPDHNAMIGKADVPGVFYATGFSGHGFLQGPAVGRDRPRPLPGPRTVHGSGAVQRRPLRRRPAAARSPHHLNCRTHLSRKAPPMTSTTERTAPVLLADTVSSAELRAQFALRLATLYGTEVPAYNTLVDVSREVNEDVVAAVGADAERLGSIDRVTAERHGAIRVGSPRELAQVARVFAGFGMHPVGFYDLRDASKSSVPVVSTAFRPVDADELAQNPFRVFTSMLVTDDRRFFDEPTQQRLERFIGERTLFGAELLELADRSAERRRSAVPRTRSATSTWRRRRSSCSPSRSTTTGTSSWRRSPRSPPTSAASRRPTSTT